MRVLSLFSGCGGMDLGFEGGFDVLKASVNPSMHPDWVELDHGNGWVRLRPTGFRTVFANDISESAKTIWGRNFSRMHPDGLGIYWGGSVVDYVKLYRNPSNDVFSFPSGIDVVTGGFPCCDFSLAGRRGGFDSHKDHLGNPIGSGVPTEESRGMLYYWMREVISIVKPRAFVAENVDALDSLGDARKVIEGDFASIGYRVRSKTLRAPSFGIPQTRDRIIFVGVKEGIPVRSEDLFPPETHGDSLFAPLSPKVKLKEVLVGLKEPTESDDPDQRAVAGNKWYGRHCQGQNEVDLDGDAPTIRAEHHGSIEFRRLSKEHGGRNNAELLAGLPERRLSVRECARIQTFPDSFGFYGDGVSQADAYRAIGNAVPPLLAYHVAMRLKETVFS